MRVKLLLALVALTAAIVPAAGSAVAEPPFLFHFKGRGAQATLTDCEVDDVDGTVCMAADIFVSDERYQERGSKSPLTLIDVIFFEVIVDSTVEGGFVATPVAAGFTPASDVSVAGNLSWASASATDIEVFSCVVSPDDELICEEPAGTTSLEVAWEATGPLDVSTFHERGVDGSLAYNFHAVDGFRPATASGTVDGVALHETPLFPPSIFKTNHGVVERMLD